VSSPGRRAVVLLSGGLDSTTTLATARAAGFDCYALTVDYGQRHQVELEAARRVAQALGAREHAVLQVDLRRFGGSALTADLAIPAGRDPAAMTDIPPTYVPARNTVFLALALAWAETLGAEDLFLGVNALDYSVDGAAVVWVRSPSWARPMPIEELYALPDGDYETIGVDRDSLEVGWRRVTRRWRHPAAHRRCLRIRLEEGQEVTISEDHSLFTVDPLTARPVPVTGARVETGTPIVVPVDLSGSAAAWPRDLSFIDLRELVRSRNGHGGRGARGARDGLGSNRGGPAQVLLGVPASDEVLYGIGLGLADGGTGLASGTGALPSAVGGTPGPAADVLGSYAQPRGVLVGTSPAGDVDRAAESPVLAALFRTLGLRSAATAGEKRFPSFFWDLSQRQRRVVVAGLWDGGGGRVASGECALAQASHPLIDDTSRCFALDGIFPSVREGSDSRRLLCLSRARDRQRFLELYPLRLLSTHTAALGRPRTNGRDEAASPCERAALGDAMGPAGLDPEAETETDATRGPGDARRRARLPAVGAGPSRPALASSGLAALRVVEIHDVRADYLYDLSVDGCENFVANGVLAHNSGYPDCRPEYIEAFERMANLATRAGVEGRSRFRIHAPLIAASKAEIVRRAHTLGVDLGLTWSCYDPQPGGRPCGVCDSCVLRRKGFAEAGLVDPLSPRPR